LTNLVECDSPTFYSIQNGASSILNQFNSDWADTAPCNVINSSGVQIFGSASISESFNRTIISIEDVSVSHIICNKSLGRIQISVEGGYQELNYSLNGVDYQDENLFENLDQGSYTVFVNDAKDCPISTEVVIGIDPKLVFDNIDITAADCNDKNGNLNASLSFEDDTIDSIYRSSLFLSTVKFGENIDVVLDAGSYTLTNKGCGAEIDTSIVIPRDLCNFYIPNVFSTNSESDENNRFSIVFQDPTSILIEDYVILDEWGSIIFKRKNFSPTLDDNWWAGMCSDKLCDQGVYSYLITIDLGRNVKRIETGTVLLLN